MITKRIDLALLEGGELLARSIQRTALVGAGMVLAAVAWCALTGALVLSVTPDAAPVLRLVGFGLLNGAGAVAFVAFAARSRRSTRPVPLGGNGSGSTCEPLLSEGRN